MSWLAIAVGGALGAVIRYLVDRWTMQRWGTGFPTGTLLVNLAGSLILGLATGLALNSDALAFIGTGFCGALTTFSGFAAQALDLDGLRRGRGVVYAMGSLACGVMMAAAGLTLGRAM